MISVIDRGRILARAGKSFWLWLGIGVDLGNRWGGGGETSTFSMGKPNSKSCYEKSGQSGHF